MSNNWNEIVKAYAPKDCQPTVISKQSRLAEYAKRLGKPVSELTEEEKQAEQEDWDQSCNQPGDWLGS